MIKNQTTFWIDMLIPFWSDVQATSDPLADSWRCWRPQNEAKASHKPLPRPPNSPKASPKCFQKNTSILRPLFGPLRPPFWLHFQICWKMFGRILGTLLKNMFFAVGSWVCQKSATPKGWAFREGLLQYVAQATWFFNLASANLVLQLGKC